MLLNARQQIKRLEAVDSESFEEVVVRIECRYRNLEMLRGQPQHFVSRILECRHSVYLATDSCRSARDRYGRYGSASVLSTNFLRPASTAGRVNSSQKISTSCSSSAYGIGLMNFLAAIVAPRSNFATCAAVVRATRSASPSPVTWLTSPIACAFDALMLRPVNSRSRTIPFPTSRFSLGIPPKLGINPSRSSGKQKRVILSATIKSQSSASSNPPPKVTPCTAAIVVSGATSMAFPTRSIRSSKSRTPATRSVGGSACERSYNSRKSAPAQKPSERGL